MIMKDCQLDTLVYQIFAAITVFDFSGDCHII